MSKTLYVEFQSEKKPRNLLRIWQILTAIAVMIAVSVTAAFICYVITHNQETNAEQHEGGIQTAAILPCPTYTHKTESSTEQHEGDIKDPASLPCPQLPTLFPLPTPTPEEITDVFEELESAVSSLVDQNSSLPAISMNVFYRNEILWSHHFGSKVYKKPEMKPNDSTVYRIGSVTKLFAVLLMYKLYEEGKISSIDDPLSKYAPNFAIKNPYTSEDITLREIASQMSGLPREAPCKYHCNTNSAEQLALLKNYTLVLPPWYSPSYSNLGYALLGRLLTENLLKQTFESWTNENIIKPLGMVNTGFEITDEVEKNMAFPYLPGGKRFPFMNFGWLAPAGQMYSTIDDLAKLGMLFAQPDKQKLFKPATLREMMTPKDITPDGVTVWGSPFEMSFKEHFLVRGKNGIIDSYRADFAVIPELGFGANILISTRYYLQEGLPEVSTLLYNVLISRLNGTLFEIQRGSHFPIDPFPYMGKFEVTKTDPIFGVKIIFNSTIKSFENILRFDYPVTPGAEMWVEIRYINERLVFQARRRSPGMSCLAERVGTLAALYFDRPGKDNLSPGFRVPEWNVVAKRVQASDETFVDERKGRMKRFTLNKFKSVI